MRLQSHRYPKKRIEAILAKADSTADIDALHKAAPICRRHRVSLSKFRGLAPDICRYLPRKSSPPPPSNANPDDGGGLNYSLNLCSPFAEGNAFLGLKFINVVVLGFGVAQRCDVIESSVANLLRNSHSSEAGIACAPLNIRCPYFFL